MQIQDPAEFFSDVPICLCLISHVSLAASLPFKWNKGTQKDTSWCIHMQRSLCLSFSLPLLVAYQHEKGWRNCLFSERRGPLLSGFQSAWEEKWQSTWSWRGLLLRSRGADYCYLCHTSLSELHALCSLRQKTPLQSHWKILNTIGQRFDLVTREIGGGKENGRKNSVLPHIKQPDLVFLRSFSRNT